MSTPTLFTIQYRDRVRDRILAMAESDARVVAAAVVGSMALSDGDRWSDLDLTFAVADDVDKTMVLEDWTATLRAEFGAVTLFDVPAGPSIYRVLLMPGCLQCDISFTPARSFGAIGPKFRLLFGTAVARPQPGPPDARHLAGETVHHLLRARFSIERGRFWHAEYWIHEARDGVLGYACLNRGLSGYYGRGFDDLPVDVSARLAGSLVGKLEREALLAALACVAAALIGELAGDDRAQALVPELRKLVAR
jgi:predicted nucleotidyltransferase